MKAIAAVSRNWGIGNNGELLFHISADMKFFRRVTTDSVVIMGRKTLESFPSGKPLPNRVNIVLSRAENYRKDGAITVHSVDGAVSEAEKYGKEIFIIGGAQIYSLFLDRCDECLITRVEACPDADSFFPDLSVLPEWEIAAAGEEEEENGIKFRFLKYKKIKDEV